MSPTRRPRVLLVDDDPAICEMTQIYLQDRCDVMVAHDGDEGIHRAHRRIPDVAILDVMMPEFSGFELGWAFERHPRLSGIPLVFITAHPDPAKWLDISHRVMRKPVGKAELHAVLDELLAGSDPERTDEPEVVDSEFERIAIRADARLTCAGESFDGALMLVSKLGIYVRTIGPLLVGSRWTLQFWFGKQRYEFPVEVIHNMARAGVPGTGCRFEGLSAEQQDALDLLLRSA